MARTQDFKSKGSDFFIFYFIGKESCYVTAVGLEKNYLYLIERAASQGQLEWLTHPSSWAAPLGR